MAFQRTVKRRPNGSVAVYAPSQGYGNGAAAPYPAEPGADAVVINAGGQYPPLAFTREGALALIEAVQGVLSDLEASGVAGDA